MHKVNLGLPVSRVHRNPTPTPFASQGKIYEGKREKERRNAIEVDGEWEFSGACALRWSARFVLRFSRWRVVRVLRLGTGSSLPRCINGLVIAYLWSLIAETPFRFMASPLYLTVSPRLVRFFFLPFFLRFCLVPRIYHRGFPWEISTHSPLWSITKWIFIYIFFSFGYI